MTSIWKLFGMIFVLGLLGGTLTAQEDTSAPDDYVEDFSPDGTQLAVSSSRSVDFDLYIIDLDGDVISRPLSDGVEVPVYNQYMSADWSPDGEVILAGTHTEKGMNLSLIDSNTGDIISQTPVESDSWLWVGEWSPDSQWVLIYDEPTVYVMERSTGELTTIVDETVLADQDKIFRSNGANWSPDGQFISINGYLNGSEEALFLYDVSEKTLSDDVLASHWITEGRCCIGTRTKWSPDSQQMAVSIAGDGTIYLVTPENTGLKPLVHTGGDVQSFVWAPDGTALYYYVSEHRQNELGVYKATLADQTIEPVWMGSPSSVSFAPDGSHFLTDDWFYVSPRVLRLVDMATGTETIFDVDYFTTLNFHWSGDSQTIAATICTTEEQDADVYLIDVPTRELTLITEDGGSPDLTVTCDLRGG